MNLPSPIQAYFDADERSDGEALIQAFAPDAVVKDEGHTYAGHQAIGAWWRETKDKYQHRPRAVARSATRTTSPQSAPG